MTDAEKIAEAKWMELLEEWNHAYAEHKRFAGLVTSAFRSGDAVAGKNPRPEHLDAADLWKKKADEIWAKMDKIIRDLDG